MKIVLVGAGNLATNLGKALKAAGEDIAQVFSRTEASARSLSELLQCSYTTEISDIRKDADIYIYALKDSVLQEIAHQTAGEDAIHLHTAGSMDMNVLQHKKHYGVFYPLQTFSKDRIVDFKSIPIFVESNDAYSLEQTMQLAHKLSEKAMYSIGSLLKNIKGITAVLNPTVNSYKRLVKDYEAPIYIVWSVVTRSALVRIPSKRGKSTRLELRSPDCATNPYLAFAVIFQTCLDGIRNKIDPPKPVEKNLFLLSSNEIKQRKIKSLPRNMFTALDEMEKSFVSKAALGDYIFEEFITSKKKEWNDYRKQVTPWELKKYLDV